MSWLIQAKEQVRFFHIQKRPNFNILEKVGFFEQSKMSKLSRNGKGSIFEVQGDF